MNMTPSGQCKANGLKSFAELVRISNMPYQTLMDWYKLKPKQFACMLAGAAAIKHRNSGWSSGGAVEDGKIKDDVFVKRWLMLDHLTEEDADIIGKLLNRLAGDLP